VQFYQAIAPNYDQRNSVNLLATHLEVITRIDQLRRAKPALRVLDLGGGTGQNVATYFFNDGHIWWTYVDSCPVMLTQVQQHLAGRLLYQRLSVHLADINRIHAQLRPRSYDVVLLNLVLSSMPTLPDFARIAGLIAPGGRLIVADINPLYTQAHPLYQATAANGSLVALRTQAVHPLDVVTRATGSGLQLSEMTQVGSDVISYSFVVSFACPAWPGEDYPHWDGEALPA
jgi:ubiquinone/menaquinone biosynthesis C-methylase UbiE